MLLSFFASSARIYHQFHFLHAVESARLPFHRQQRPCTKIKKHNNTQINPLTTEKRLNKRNKLATKKFFQRSEEKIEQRTKRGSQTIEIKKDFKDSNVGAEEKAEIFNFQ